MEKLLKKFLIQKFEDVVYDSAKKDVLPFIKNTNNLDLWSKIFFVCITENLT